MNAVRRGDGGTDALLVISQKKLRDFWIKHRDAEKPLRAWYQVVSNAAWKTFADLRRTYPHADKVGRCTVFDIKGNRYRLVAIVSFEAQTVSVRRVMTHEEYSRNRWKGECQ